MIQLQKNTSIAIISLLAASVNPHLDCQAQPITAGHANTTQPTYIAQGGVDMAESGRFDITFNATYGAPLLQHVHERSYNAGGSPLFTTDQLVYNNTPSNKNDPGQRVAMNNNGSYIIAYYENNNTVVTSPDYCSIYFQKYNINGTQNGARVFVAYGMFPDIDMADDGTFSIAYQSGHYYTNPLVFVRRFTSAGVQVGGVITAAPAASTNNRYPRVRSRNSNAFVVSYLDGISGFIKTYSTAGTQTGGTITFPQDLWKKVNFVVKPNGDLVVLNAQFAAPWTQTYIIKWFLAGTTVPSSTQTIYSGNCNLCSFDWNIGSNSNGDYVICYPFFNGNTFIEQRVQQYNSTDNLIGPAYPVTTNIINESDWTYLNYPEVGVGQCKFVVSWMDINSSGVRKIAYERFQLPGNGPYANAGPDKNLTYGCGAGGNTAVLGTPGLGYNYSWSPSTYLNATNIAQPTITYPGGPTLSITYTVTVTDPATNCSSTDQVGVSMVSCRIGSGSESSINEISLNPNPAYDNFEIRVPGESTSGNYSIRLTDIMGRTVLEEQNLERGKSNFVNLAEFNLKTGLYYLVVNFGTTTDVKKVMLIRN